MTRDYYKVLYVGRAGNGKTYSFRNMNPLTTGFINVENKPLPFKNTFKYHARPSTVNEIKTSLSEYSKNPEITSIVVDSFSAFVDILLSECRATKKGFDVWSTYAEEIGKFLNFIKKIEKEVFITAHYEWLQGEEGVKEKRIKVKGKEWEGLVEKEFTIVLYSDITVDDKGKPHYYFNTFQENSSTKCPPDIFGEDVLVIDNDSNYVLNKILEFVK